MRDMTSLWVTEILFKNLAHLSSDPMQSEGASQTCDDSLSDPFPTAQAARLRRTMTEAEDRKQKNRIAHSKPGSVIVKPARKKKIVAEME